MTLPHIEPSLAEFVRGAANRRVISVYARLRADGDTPISLYHQLCGQRPGTFLLESASAGIWSRWSFIGVRSSATLTAFGGPGSWTGQIPEILDRTGDPLELIEQAQRLLHTAPDPGLPPFTSGLVGALGYDIVRRLERLPDTTVDDLGLPDIAMLLATDIAAFDHHRNEVWLIANAFNWDDTAERVADAWRDARDRVQQMARILAEPRTSLVAGYGSDGNRRGDDQPGGTRSGRQHPPTADYHQAIETSVAEIKAGEAFQVVISRRFDVPNAADALDVYRELRGTNPSPYMYLLRMGDFDIVGSSPEALVTIADGEATTHPIAGSRPRGRDAADDAALEVDLVADPKERAEHLMLVDLARNDLGRVCRPGTVRVIEFMVVRRYSHIMHLESTVTGQLADQVTPLRATLACFPAGTLSGAPKVRAMEIIDRLETTRRGIYGGTVGYFDFAGNADNAIAIRTAILRDDLAHVQAGGGIVADSTADYEDAESAHKAAAVLQAIAAAQRLTPLRPDERPGTNPAGTNPAGTNPEGAQ